MKADESRSNLTEEKMEEKDRQLISDVQEMEEHRILKSLEEINIDHEMVCTHSNFVVF